MAPASPLLDDGEGKHEDYVQLTEREEEPSVSRSETVLSPRGAPNPWAQVPKSEDHPFFKVGRELQSSSDFHVFSDAEKKRMALYESLDYLQIPNAQFKQHLARKSTDKIELLGRFAMYGFIGIVVGLVGVLLFQTLGALWRLRIYIATELIDHGSYFLAYLSMIAQSALLVFFSSYLIVYVEPAAGGSGIPEVMGYLNGVHLPKVLNVRTMVVKVCSTLLSVASGLPVGGEGPMIHIGASVGAGVSQGRSKTLGISSRFFSGYRNTQDKRDFVTAGSAAGVAAVFSAPIGGTLFVLEEVASFWQRSVTWLMLFCSMLSVIVLGLFSSAFDGWRKIGEFGQWNEEAAILFLPKCVVRFTLAVIPPSFVVGIVGGVLGALFTFGNLKFARLRAKWVGPHKKRRIAEPVILCLIYISLLFFITYSYPCSSDMSVAMSSKTCIFMSRASNSSEQEEALKPIYKFGCQAGTFYNSLALMSMSGGEDIVHKLLNRGVAREFEASAIAIFLVVYFIFACYTGGTAISSGMVIPTLVIGSAYGRLIGLGMSAMFGEDDWLDPGVYAFLGAAAFFAGIARITVALCIIMVELSNESRLLLPIMISVFVAKYVADQVTHSLYIALLEVKCVPFLEPEPPLPMMDCFTASQVMSKPVVCLPVIPRVSEVIEVLKSEFHHAFPVVSDCTIVNKIGDRSEEMSKKVFRGVITRDQLEMLLSHKKLFRVHPIPEVHPVLSFEEAQEWEEHRHMSRRERDDLLKVDYRVTDEERDKFLPLEQYMNESALSVGVNCSLKHTYILFRSMALRHLVVVNQYNEVCGVITRKDLLACNMASRIGTSMGITKESQP